MKFLVLCSLLAVAAAAENGAEEQTRDKRGVLGLGLGGYPALGYAAGYPSLGYGYGAYAAPLPVAKVIAPAYHAPIAPAYHAPIAKVIAPLPAVKVIQPYSAPILPAYGLGYGHGYGVSHGYSLNHGLGYGLGYGYGGLLH